MSTPTLSDRTVTGLRATTGDAVLVARRRSRQDAGLLTLAAVVLAVTVLIALAVPRVVLRMADEGARQSVIDAGHAADVVAVLAGGPGVPETDVQGRPIRPDDAAVVAANAARDMRTVLPSAVLAATGTPVTAVQSPAVRARVLEGAADGTVLASRLVHVADATSTEPVAQWVRGAEPRRSPDPADGTDAPVLVEVGVSASAADRLGLEVGQHLELDGTTRVPTHAVISGVYEPVDAGSPVWSSYPDLLDQVPTSASAIAAGRVALLLSDESLPDLILQMESPRALTTSYRYPADPTDLLATDLRTLRSTVTRLEVAPGPLTGSDGRIPTVDTELDTVLRTAEERLAAATAQTSVLLVGLAVAGALVLVLAARLLVVRRHVFLVAERARGASVASVALRSLVETVPLVLVATAVGALGAWLIQPDGRGPWSVAAVIVLVAILAPAIAAATVVASAWTGRRLPANRVDRDRVLGRRRARRLTGELALVAVAVAALVSVRSRGLVQTATGNVDLLLAATPVLLAAAATVLVARLLPPLLRALSRRTSRRRGLVGIVATARASLTSGTRVPLLTLTIAVALVVFCGTTAVTVQRGQHTAADIVVGAEVRVDGKLDERDLEALRQQPGVTAAAGATSLLDRTFGRESGKKTLLVLVDAAELAPMLEARERPVDERLSSLGTGEGVPVLITESLENTAELVAPSVMGIDEFVDLRVVGTTEHPPAVPAAATSAREPDGITVADRGAFRRASGSAVAPTTIWVDGPGAVTAVRAVGLTETPGVGVTIRSEWLQTWQDSPINAGLLTLLIGTGLLLAGYAALALVLTVVATSRERGRTLSALRTLGLDARTARAITFGELAPLAIAAVVAGTGIGLAVPWMLTGALGLGLLTGDPAATALQVTWVPVVGAAAVVLVALAAAVLVESAVRRRDRLGEVLRVGER